MLLLAVLLSSALAEPPNGEPQNTDPAAHEVIDKIQSAREGISETERRQREALSGLFVINKKVRAMAVRQERLNQKLLSQEATVRSLAQEVQELESRADSHKVMLNKRLRQLYQERDNADIKWLFSSQSPVELERNHRYLRRLIDADHQQLKTYILALRDLQKKRAELKDMARHLAVLQKQSRVQEAELTAEMQSKSKYIAELKKSKDVKLSELKGLRSKNGDLSGMLNYAFFERKGALLPPVDLPVTREYGTYVDPNFKFRLTHKGLFFSAPRSVDVRAVFHGKVVFANRLPGLGKTAIVDHGDNYYSVYAFASTLKVKEGANVQEGDVLAVSGRESPLFGPGLYFEIRHFTDAVDPRPWIKDSVLKTADNTGERE